MQGSTQALKVHEMRENASKKRSRTILFTSGKGGIGKTNVALNLALALSQKGKSVTLMDANTQMTDIPILMGVEQKNTYRDVLFHGKEMEDLALRDASGLRVLAVDAGGGDVENMEASFYERMRDTMYRMSLHDDFIVVDTPAGITRDIADLALRVDDVVVMTTPEPAAVSDAYALIKILNGMKPGMRFQVVISLVRTKDEADDVYERFALVVDHFLESRAEYLGFVLEDDSLRKAVRDRIPVLKAFPHAPASKCVEKIAWRVSA